jgi:hypothetical protein
MRILALLSSLLGVAPSRGAEPIDVSALSEASMNFDQEHVGPFLLYLSKTVGGDFDSAAAEKITEAIDRLRVEETANWEFDVAVAGGRERLVMVAFKDDVDAPDLAFYTSPELAARIQEELESFGAEQGW